MTPTEARVVEATRRFTAARGGLDRQPSVGSTVCQDLLIFGIDVDDYVAALSTEFGAVVWSVPWLRFTDQTGSFRGVGCLLFPFWLAWRLLRWPFRRGVLIPRPDPRSHGRRLTLGHLAAVIDAGYWFEPESTV